MAKPACVLPCAAQKYFSSENTEEVNNLGYVINPKKEGDIGTNKNEVKSGSEIENITIILLAKHAKMMILFK